MRKTFYLRNPNDYAKANMKQIKHKDSRVQMDLPDYIEPLQQVEVGITIPPMKFKSAEDEREFFKNVIDTMYGTIIWEQP